MATSTSAKHVETSATKSLQTELGNIKAKKTPQPLILGGSWAPFGEGLGRSGASSGRSWALLGRFLVRSKSSFYTALAQDRLQDASWIDLGAFGEGFGRVLGASWPLLGPFLDPAWPYVGQKGRILDLLSEEWADSGNAGCNLALLQQSF